MHSIVVVEQVSNVQIDREHLLVDGIFNSV
jgi:hypothetical protein